jgi:hypothetical protein
MPCNNGGWPEEDSSYQRLSKEHKNVEALLCGIFTVLDKDRDELDHFLDIINWEEVGISKAYAKSWWFTHKIQDQQRRKNEQLVKERELRIKAAKDKLTLEELHLLNIKI